MVLHIPSASIDRLVDWLSALIGVKQVKRRIIANHLKCDIEKNYVARMQDYFACNAEVQYSIVAVLFFFLMSVK